MEQVQAKIDIALVNFKDDFLRLEVKGLVNALGEFATGRSMEQRRSIHSAILVQALILEPHYLEASYRTQIKFLGPLCAITMILDRSELDSFHDIHNEAPSQEKIEELRKRLVTRLESAQKLRAQCWAEATAASDKAVTWGV